MKYVRPDCPPTGQPPTQAPPRGTVDTASWFGDTTGSAAVPPRLLACTPVPALFNLGVAVFDTVVDDEQDAFPELATALHPDRLADRRAIRGDEGRVACTDARAEFVVALFDRSLRSVATRLGDELVAREGLHDLLRRLYDSEVGISDDPSAAKTLPVVFIGSLASRDPQIDELYARLALFLCLYDDWQDVESDRRSGRFNAFSRVGEPGVVRAFEAVLDAARSCPPGVGARLSLLCT